MESIFDARTDEADQFFKMGLMRLTLPKAEHYSHGNHRCSSLCHSLSHVSDMLP